MRAKLKPATGHVRWVGNAANGNRQLEITTNGISQTYEVVRSLDGGFNLLRVKDYVTCEIVCYTVRSINPRVWACNCPDATNRPSRRYSCKHALALSTALRSLPF